MSKKHSQKGLSMIVSLLVLAALITLVFYIGRIRNKPQTQVVRQAEKQERRMLMGASKLLDPLPDDATEGAKMQKYKDYQNAAKEAPYLEVKDCKPDPVLIKSVDKPNLIIKNSGEGTRQIWFNDQHWTIPEQSQIQVSLDFAKEAKQPRYWYVCDLNTNVVSGMIWVAMGDDR